MTQKIFHARPLVAAISIATMAVSSVATAQSYATSPSRNADYWQNVSDLATNMGSAHAIHISCNGEDDQFWRVKMLAMLNMEAANEGPTRTMLIDAFNNSYNTARQQYPWCDNVALNARSHVLRRMAELSTQLTARNYPGYREPSGSSRSGNGPR